MALDLHRPDSFDVARPRQIEVAPGDKILIRANDKRLGLTNGQVLTISNIALDGALQTKEGLRVPADFRQWCHGYVVTCRRPKGGRPITSSLRGTLHVKRSLRGVLSRP